MFQKKLGNILMPLRRKLFHNSIGYWEKRYVKGGMSGLGSYGRLAEFKAKVINSFIQKNKISSVIEFGCGDGSQARLGSYHSYIGLDVSKTAVQMCINRFKNDKKKSFFLYDPKCFKDSQNVFRARLALSLDVIYHIIEDEIFELYMKHLFSVSEKFVIIYSSDMNKNDPFEAPHVKHRRFSEWIKHNMIRWKLKEKVSNKYPYEIYGKDGSLADFFIYEKCR